MVNSREEKHIGIQIISSFLKPQGKANICRKRCSALMRSNLDCFGPHVHHYVQQKTKTCTWTKHIKNSKSQNVWQKPLRYFWNTEKADDTLTTTELLFLSISMKKGGPVNTSRVIKGKRTMAKQKLHNLENYMYKKSWT